MSNLLKEISITVLTEKNDERSADLTQDGKKANKEISQMGFSLIKDMINKGDELTTTDVNDYLDKADTINDDVDTVVFGLETDDNEIVKVYVACTDADAFEQAMAERLGTEDDIEDVIAELAQEYDIVDVEWPDEDEKENEESDEEEPETQNSTGDESSEAETELNFDKPIIAKEQKMEDNMATFGERFKARIISSSLISEAKKEERQWPTEIDEFAKTLTTPAQEAILYLITLFDLPREVISSKKSIGEFRRNIYKASHEYTKNQTLKIWVNKLTKELDNSAKKDEEVVKEAVKSEKEKDDIVIDWDDPKLLKAAKFRDSLPHGVPRLIFDVLLSLGVPHDMLTDINRTKVRNSIREFSFKVRRNQQIHIYLNLIADAFGIKSDDQTEIASHSSANNKTIKEAKIEQNPEQQDYIIIVKELLTKLGVPTANLEYKSSFVTRALKARKMQLRYSFLIPKLEIFLSNITNAENIKNEDPIVEAMNKEQNYETLIKDLAIALGFPLENLNYKASMLTQALLKRRSTLNWSSLIPKMKKLLQIIKSSEIKQESIKELTTKLLNEMVTTRMHKDDGEEATDFDKILNKGKTKDKEEDSSIDVGKWNFASLGSVGLTMRARGIKLQFEDIVAERIAKMIGDGKSASVKTVEGDRVVFSPKDRGHSYVIKGIPKFETGVKVSNKDVDNLLDALGAK